MKKILMFAGSNNPKSLNQTLIHFLAEMIDEDKRTVINIHHYQLPLYSGRLEAEGIPESAITLRKLMDEYYTFIIGVPEHNGSISAFFKNTMDWLTRAEKGYKLFMNKHVALVSASPVGGGANALDHAEAIVKRLGAIVTDKVAIPKFHEQTFTDETGLHFKDPELLDKLMSLVKNISEQQTQTIAI